MKPRGQVISSPRQGKNGRRLAGATLCLSAVAACTLFNPLDAYGPPKPKSDAGGVEASVVSTCSRTRWPERPTKDDATGDVEVVFALKTLDVGAPTDAGNRVTTGFDFDGVCTCPDPPSCRPAPDASMACDLDGGIDDKGTELVQSIGALGRIGNDTNERLSKGKTGLILRLAKYNGAQNDSQVELAVFLSLGTETDDAGDEKPPLHDGQDRWTVDRESLFGRNGPPYVPTLVDSDAYVAGGWLVTNVAFPLAIGELEMNLTESVLIARVVPDGASYRLEDGRVSGRWPASRLLTVLDSLSDPFSRDGGGLCGSSSLYADLKKRVCSAVDLTADRQKDNTGAQCDALGMTVLFTAEPAQLGYAVDRPPRSRLCGADWTDDCSR